MRHVPRSVDALFGQSQSRLLIDLDSHDLTAHDLTNGIYITDTITPGMASPQLVYFFISRTFPLTDAHIVEVRLTPDSTARFDTIRKAIHQYIWNSYETIALPSKLDGWKDVSVLASSVEQVTACESSSPTSYLPVAQAALQIHVYQPNDGDAANGFSAGLSNDGEEIMAASVCELPSRQWEGLWDSLIFPDDTKTKLLDYIYATVLFSDANVDCKLWLTSRDALTQYIHSQHRIMESRRTPTWATGNRKNFTLQSSRTKALYTIVTSVCTPIASFAFFFNPLLIARSYPHSRLLEINSHSLFSRWFSESGKLVQKLFGSVMDLVEDEDTFVVVLIGTFMAYSVAILVSSYDVCTYR